MASSFLPDSVRMRFEMTLNAEPWISVACFRGPSDGYRHCWDRTGAHNPPQFPSTSARHGSAAINAMPIAIAALAGLRVREIAKIKREDVDLAGRTLHVIGKGRCGSNLAAAPRLVEAAASMRFRAVAGGSRRSWHPQNPILPVSVSRTVGRVMRRLDVPGSAHSLRHWYGTTLVRDGADLRTAQTVLRHAPRATTQIYVGVTDERRNEAVDKLDPLGSPPPSVSIGLTPISNAGDLRRACSTTVRVHPAAAQGARVPARAERPHQREMIAPAPPGVNLIDPFSSSQTSRVESIFAHGRIPCGQST